MNITRDMIFIYLHENHPFISTDDTIRQDRTWYKGNFTLDNRIMNSTRCDWHKLNKVEGK